MSLIEQIYCSLGVKQQSITRHISNKNNMKECGYKCTGKKIHRIFIIFFHFILFYILFSKALISIRCKKLQINFFYDWFDFWCFNAIFSNISAISWRPVLVVEEARVPGENHRPRTSNWRLRVECTFFVIYKDGREPTPYWW